jgi:hypothetical protein
MTRRSSHNISSWKSNLLTPASNICAVTLISLDLSEYAEEKIPFDAVIRKLAKAKLPETKKSLKPKKKSDKQK